jgi:hypothetical protein
MRTNLYTAHEPSAYGHRVGEEESNGESARKGRISYKESSSGSW